MLFVMDTDTPLETGRKSSSSSDDDDSIQSWELVKSIFEAAVDEKEQPDESKMATTAEYRPLLDQYSNLPSSSNYNNFSPLSVNVNKDVSPDSWIAKFDQIQFLSDNYSGSSSSSSKNDHQNPSRFQSHLNPTSPIYQTIPRRIQKNSLCSLDSDELSISPSSDHFDRAVAKPSSSSGAIPRTTNSSFYGSAASSPSSSTGAIPKTSNSNFYGSNASSPSSSTGAIPKTSNSNFYGSTASSPSTSTGAIPKTTNRNFYGSSASSPERQIAYDFDVSQSICDMHLKPKIFYCCSCCMNICLDCRTKQHVLCTITTLRKRLEEEQERLVKEFKLPLEQINKKLMEKTKLMDMLLSEKKGEICEFRDTLNNAVIEREKALMNDINAVKDSYVKQWQERTTTCEKYIQKLKEIEMRHLNYKDLYEVESERQMLNKTLKKLEAPLPEFKVDFTYDKQIVSAIRNQLGKVTSYLSPTNSYIYQETAGLVGQRGSIVLKLCDHANNPIYAAGIDLKVTLIDKYNNILRTDYNFVNGVYRIFYDPIYICGSYYLTILVNNDLVNGRTFELVIKSKKEIRNIFGPYSCFGNYGTSDSLNKPWGVTCDNSGRIYVGDRLNNRVMIYTIEGMVLGTIGYGKGDGDGQLNLPSGVCFDSTYQRLIVADKDNHRIQIFSLDGRFMFKFGRFGSENGEFHYPWDVATNSQGLIAVSDGKNNRVQLFDPFGNYLAQFPPEKTVQEKEEERLREMEAKKRYKNYKEGKSSANDPRKLNFRKDPRLKLLHLPRGVAFMPDDSLLVTDFENHKIVHLDRSLQFKRHIGSAGDGPYRFFRPNGIAVDKNGRYAVSDGKNYRVQVFDSKGALTAIFGHEGSRHGDFDWPQGIAFHPSEKILVVEVNTARVQAF